MATKKKGKAKSAPSGKKKSGSKKGLTVKTYSGLNKNRMKNKGGGGNRVIIKEGDTVTVQFLDRPKDMREYDEHVYREGGSWVYVPCSGDGCPDCDSDREDVAKTSYKFIANVWNFKEKKVQILAGPKTLATQIFYRYQRKPDAFLKRVYDITKFPTNPITYNFELAEESPIKVSGLKRIDLDEYMQGELDRVHGEFMPSSGSKKGKTALDDEDWDEDDEDDEEIEDDEDYADEDEYDEDDEDEEEEDDDDDDEDDDEDDEDEPDEDELLDKDAWPWSDLKEYAKEVGVKKKTKNREELVRWIIKKRDK